jgi:hypothetical protein
MRETHGRVHDVCIAGVDIALAGTWYSSHENLHDRARRVVVLAIPEG